MSASVNGIEVTDLGGFASLPPERGIIGVASADLFSRQAALYAALAEAIETSAPVARDSWNDYHKYRYASSEGLLAEGRAALGKHGLCLIPMSPEIVVIAPADGSKETEILVTEKRKDGDQSRRQLLLKRTIRLAHKDGGYLDTETLWPIYPEKGRAIDKAVASAATTSLGYFVRDLLLLPRVDHDEDMDTREDRPSEGPRRNGRQDRSEPPAHEEAPKADKKSAESFEQAAKQKPGKPALFDTAIRDELAAWGSVPDANHLASLLAVDSVSAETKRNLTYYACSGLKLEKAEYSKVGDLWESVGVKTRGESITGTQASLFVLAVMNARLAKLAPAAAAAGS